MKVALLFYHLTCGGVQRASVILANGFAARGLDVDFVLLKATGEFLDRLSPKVRVVDLGMKRSYPPQKSLLLPSSPLLKYLRGETSHAKPDVLFCLGHVINRLAGWLKFIYRVPEHMLFAERNHLSARFANNSPWQRWRRVTRARFLYSMADVCVGVSQGVTDDLVEMGIVERARARTVYNAVYRPELLEMAARPLAHPWFRAGEPPVIISAGRLVAEKNIDVLLRAFRLVLDSGTPARLLLFGEGPDRQKLETLARELALGDNVSFAGYEANPYSYMSRAGLLVLASRYEGLPNTLVEALCCGCNVVAADCPSGPREILKDGRWGRLVPVGDAEALAQGIRDTLKNPLPREALVRRGQFFSLDNALDGYISIMQELCTTKDSGRKP